MLLAYFDVRPILFVLTLPVFVVLVLAATFMIPSRWRRGHVVAGATALFTVAYLFVLYGPFVGYTDTHVHEMTWRVEGPSVDMQQEHVVLTFVDYPNRYIGEYSDELADHLERQGREVVSVTFEVTYDYGTMRGFRPVEIAGLRGWVSEWSHAGAAKKVGSVESPSPWD